MMKEDYNDYAAIFELSKDSEAIFLSISLIIAYINHFYPQERRNDIFYYFAQKNLQSNRFPFSSRNQ